MKNPLLKVFLGAVLLQACLALAVDRRLEITPAKSAPGGQKRVALIIGNAAYKTAPLRNPVNDARAIGKALAGTGFRVTVIEDATHAAMWRAIRDFGDELAAGGIGLFYYAGHGMQVRGKNYLIPVNADLQREDEVEFQAIDANIVLSKMDSARNPLNIMILDACRNNPFARSFRSSAQGLAQMEAPSGTLVAFATAPGSVAADGDGANGLYTKHLLANIGTPGLPVEQLFKQVRIGVTRETKDQQIPWESSSLKGDFYFVMPRPGETLQQADVDRRVADAVRAEREQMQQTIREMLARQRAELEEQIRRQGGTPAARPEPVAAPALQTVSSAPTPVASASASDARLPKIGDRWEYVFTDVLTRRKQPLRFDVVGVSSEGILDRLETGGQTLTRAHAPGADLFFTNGGHAWHLSPYLLTFGEPSTGERWEAIVPLNDLNCAQLVRCRYEGRAAGTERVTTPAGTFDALKIVVEFHGQSANTAREPEVKRATFWYAAAAKRLVKASLRTVSGGQFNPQPDFDLDLVSYKLN
ncbi:MAG TPA: caspase family protein [Burkholderiales bacterium]|nr:caspase family protein [Burkholderiales bacterium]